MDIAKASILDMFLQHLEEEDWIEGLDLYQAGKVTRIQDFSGLITAEVSSNLRAPSEVRLKIHPSGKRIQWIECSCPKYRSHGQYCEHMAAFMINIDREKPHLLGALDSQMPLKPPAPRKKINSAPKSLGATRSIATNEGSTQAILSHLKNQIHSATLLAHGPNIRVRLEIKPGSLTQYNLDLDAAAKFLQAHEHTKFDNDELRHLKVYASLASPGFRIYQEQDESIVVERVIALAHNTRSADKAQRAKSLHHTEVESVKQYSDHAPTGKIGIFEFLSLKTANRYIGSEFIFIPDRGYWPIDIQSVSPQWNDFPLRQVFHEDAAAALLTSGLFDYRKIAPIWIDPALDAPDIQHSLSLAEIKILREADGWYYLDPRYEAGESTISMAKLLEHFKNKNRNFIKSGKSWIKIPDFIKDHEWELDETGNMLKVNSLGLMRLHAALGNFDQFVGSKALLNKIRNKLEFAKTDDLPTLDHTKLSLRSYQAEGYSWLWWLYKNGLHGLLADEMGLGKTHQAMAIMSGIQKVLPDAKFLIICPTTVIDHWLNKIDEFCPGLKALRHHGANRTHRLSAAFKSHHTIVTSYGIMLRDIASLSQENFGAVILDEAHYIKNNVTSTYKAVCKLDAKFRICLTGTPMENHLGELKNIFDFLMPGYLGSEEYFKKKFLAPLEDNSAPENELALQRLIHPFKMRRIKSNVLKDLPAKVEDYRHCELSKDQTKLYKQILDVKASPLIKQLENTNSPVPYLHVFQVITLLKQVCDHPALVTENADYERLESGKFESFRELLDEALDSDHKVVVYSQYLKMIDILDDYLTKRSVHHAVLTGKTVQRGAVIAEFQTNPNCRVFCGSLLAGGIGIDLTSASVVIHYDRWWNASKENQATDRVHRIGQHKNVQVFKMVTKGTLEEKIDLMIRSKQSIFERFLDQDEELFKKFTRQELIDLLS